MTSVAHPFGGVVRRLVLLLLAPFAIVTLLFLLLGNGLHRYPLVIANADEGFDMPMAGHVNLPENLIKALDGRAFAVTIARSEAAARERFDGGSAKALLLFPAELTKNMMIKLDDPTYVIPDKIKLEITGVNPLVRLFVVATIARSSIAAIQESSGGLSADALPVPIDVASIASGFEAAPPYLLTVILGFVCWAVTGIIALGAAIEIKAHRLVETRNPFVVALVFAVSFAVAGALLYGALMLAVGAILGVSSPPGLLAGSLVLTLLFAAAASLAFAAAMTAGRPERARAAVAYLILPLFVGGFLFPAELLPTWLQWLPWIFPPAYGLPASVGVELGQRTMLYPWSIAVTAAWALLFWLLGALAFRRAGRLRDRS